MDLKKKANELPKVPGVYLMKDSSGDIIYVGKSKKLKSRVSSYFQNSKHHSPKVVKMVKNIRDFDYRVTDTEFEALLLECSLIHKIKPIYNRMMKSPEGYVYLKIAINEDYPQITICNEQSDDGCLYFGPYTNHNTVERAVEGIKLIRKIQCNNMGMKRSSTCLNYSLGLCMGICRKDDASKKAYGKVIKEIIDFLNEKDNKIAEDLKCKMMVESEKMDFTEAARFRDYVSAADYLKRKQKVVRNSNRNRNLIVVEKLDEKYIKIFLIKGSKLLFDEKILISGESDGAVREKIKECIILYFSNSRALNTKEMGKDDIDQAQIIYSYLRYNKGCKYAIIPDIWVKNNQIEKLDKATEKLLYLLDEKTSLS